MWREREKNQLDGHGERGRERKREGERERVLIKERMGDGWGLHPNKIVPPKSKIF